MTSGGLSRMPDTSLADLSEVSDGMQRYIRAADNDARQAAMDAMNRRGVLRRLFPSEIDRENQRIAVDSLRQLAASKRELLTIYTTTQIEIARKQADALLASHGMDLQTKLAGFAESKIQELNGILNKSLENFMREMDPQFDMIARYQHRPALYQPAETMILHQISTYFESVKSLLDGFSHSLKNRVNQREL